MDQRLIAFLKHCIANKGESYTHTSIITPKKRYFITPDKEDEFHELYSKVINEGGISGLTEKPGDKVPVIVDFDFRHDPETVGTTRQYTAKTIKRIVRIYQEVLSDIIEDTNPRSLICVVLEKSSPRIEKGETKDGFHLHFPFLVTLQAVQKKTLRNRVIDKIIAAKVLSKLKLTNKIDKILDAGVPGVFWLMYGSRKDPELEPFLVTKIYSASCNKLTVEQAFRYTEPKPFLAEKSALDTLIEEREKLCITSERDAKLKRKTRIKSTKKKKKVVEKRKKDKLIIVFEDEDEDDAEKDAAYYLPKHMSIRNPKFETKVKESILKRVQKPPKISRQVNELMNKAPGDVHKDLNTAKDLIAMLKPSRADHYDEWMNIGWILNNIGIGSGRALDMWIDFSKNSDKYKDGECDDLWDKMKFRDLGVGTLRMYAKADNKDAYDKWFNKNMDNFFSNAINRGTNHTVARVMHKLYEDKYVCANIEKSIWFEFKDHHWYRVDGGVSLSKKISSDLVHRFRNNEFECSKKIIAKNSGDEERSDLEDRKKKINALISKLETTTFKKAVMKEAMELFYNKDFLPRLDEKVMLLGFTNGVYDLEHGVFREGHPEDYISLSTDIEYHEYEDDDAEVIEVEEYFEEVFVDPALRTYFMRFAASCLRGGNVNKLFMVWSGAGDNSKSVVVELLERIFGTYRIKFPTSLLTGKRTQSSGATPEMARIKGVRIAFLQEPDNTDNMNIGVVKELSGNDSVYVRGLYKEGQEVKPMFKLILICNKKPNVPSEDKATWNRLRVLPFESTFSMDAPKDRDEQFRKKIFPMDPCFGAKLPHMAQPFMWMLTQEFKKYLKDGIREPDRVKKATNDYRRQNDTYLEFIDSYVEEKAGGKIRIMELYSLFKDWYKDGFPGQKVPSRSDLKTDLCIRWGKPTRCVWKGWALREDESDGESDDEDGYTVPIAEEDDPEEQ